MVGLLESESGEEREREKQPGREKSEESVSELRSEFESTKATPEARSL
jgi:hypothetical protein